ncbi:MAG: hypothetical protein LBU61_04500 [Coriobacteriales bacterium]|jgi:hypothetical protein|nr:hypothetical protein [Coriobacteriales bacterium]
MNEHFLTEEILATIAQLRQKPISFALAAYLMGMYGKDGYVAQFSMLQEEVWSTCSDANTRHCNCGRCAPYRDGPLLDEVLADIQAFEKGRLTLNEKGESINTVILTEDQPF